MRSLPKLPILTFFQSLFESEILHRTKLPILTPMRELKNYVLFFTNLHNKTSHFFTFFSIFPLFVQKVRRFLTFFAFFCHFFTFFLPPPPLLAQNQGCLKPPHTQKHTQKYIFFPLFLHKYPNKSPCIGKSLSTKNRIITETKISY